MTIGILASVAAVKILTTSLSIGSGGSGGVFGPSMVIGGCAGAAFGQAAHQLFPNLVPYPEAYAVVGMAGFFSGVARAPISTIIMIRELTGDFGLVVPTMLVATLTFILSGHWKLYRKQVPTRMESPAHRGDFLVDVLEGLRVEDVYRKGRQIMTIHEGTTLDEIVHRLAETTQHYFPVVDTDGEMVGIFSDDDVRSYLYDETLWRLANARDVMTTEIVKVSPDDDLNTALQRFTALNLDELPVIDDKEPGRLLGFLRRKETIAAYNRRILEHRRVAEQE
jgi:CIC family chloride channel protein